MKAKVAALALLFVTIQFPLPTAFAQGSLTPPGAPAAAMKSLAQIEPRTPISAAPFTITQPGSYYLTTNLSVSTGDGITISGSGVFLDLNGFAIRSTAASPVGAGILINNARNLTIQNGLIEGGVTNNGSGAYGGPGFAMGVDLNGSTPASVRITGLAVAKVMYDGIFLGGGEDRLVESCSVRTVGGFGIVASVVAHSTAVDCGQTAINRTQASDCHGKSSGFGVGVQATTAMNCYGASLSGAGLVAVTANNCYAESGSGIGLQANTAANCYGYSNTGAGISAITAENCYGFSGGTGAGVSVNAMATGCFGQSNSGPGVSALVANNCVGSTSGSGTAIQATRVAVGCYGNCSGSGAGLITLEASGCNGTSGSGTGLSAAAADHCYGRSNGAGTGLQASYTATGCYGYSSSGTGLFAFIANVCHGETSTGTALSTTHNVNSF